MLSSLLLLLLPVYLVVSIARRVSGRGRGGVAQPVRGFFQYAVSYGLLAIVASGLSGLLGLLFGGGTTLVEDPSALARNLSFTVVGTPVLALLIVWARRRIAADPAETQAPALGFVVMASTLTSLAVSLSSLSTLIGWVLRTETYSPDVAQAAAQLIVWGAVWVVLWRAHRRLSTRAAAQTHHLIGSAVTGAVLVVSMVTVVRQLLAMAFGMGGVALVSSTQESVARSVPGLLVALLGWSVYWLRTASREPREPLWHAYVLLGGAGVGFVMVVAAASTLLFRVLVWFIGQPGTADAHQHFESAPISLGIVIAGGMWWAHHRALLGARRERTEIVRVYDYVMSGISLIASAVGLSIVVVAGIEALLPGTVLVGTNSRNTMLAALTLLVVGGPLWWAFWHRIQGSAHEGSSTELSSPTRRVYLYILFGVGGIAAIVSLLIAVYQLFDGIISSSLSGSTVREMRYALGVLVSTALIAAYHWTVFRHERDVDVEFGGHVKSVMLIGADDHDALRQIAQRSGARVQHWKRTDSDVPWDVDRVVALIADVAGDELVIVADPSGPFAIPVKRR